MGRYKLLILLCSYESKKCQSQVQTFLDSLRGISLPLESILDPWVPCCALHGYYCFSHDFTYMVIDNKTRSRKADQSAKPCNDTVYGQCSFMSVAISQAKKMKQAQSDNSVDFPKSSHIQLCIRLCGLLILLQTAFIQRMMQSVKL